MAHGCPLQDEKGTSNLYCSDNLWRPHEHNDASSRHWHDIWKKKTLCDDRKLFRGLHSYWMDEGWSCHRRSRRGCFAFVAQWQDVFLQVCDPLLLDWQRSMKHLFTEPDQRHREGSKSLLLVCCQVNPSNIQSVPLAYNQVTSQLLQSSYPTLSDRVTRWIYCIFLFMLLF